MPARGDHGLDHGGAEPAGPAGDDRGAVHVRSVSQRSTFVAMKQTVRYVPSALASTFADVFVRELEDGQVVEQVLLVREAQRRSTRSGGDYLRLVLGRPHGHARRGAVGLPGGRIRAGHGRRRGARDGPLRRPRALRPAAQAARPCARPRRPSTSSPTCSTARRATPSRWSATCASWWARSRTRTCARLLDALIGAGLRAVAALPRRAGGQVLPPGLPARPARALPRRRPGGQRDQRDVPRRSTATSRSPARCCTTSASSRPTPSTGAAIEHDRRRQAAGRDPARLLPRPPRDRGPRRLPARARRGGPAHHPRPTTARSSTAARSCPCTREATLVHMIDNLGGRLGSFDRLEKELPAGARWSGYDRALDSSAYFADRSPRTAKRPERGSQRRGPAPPEPPTPAGIRRRARLVLRTDRASSPESGRAISLRVNERDIDGYLACCTEDIELHGPLPEVTGVYDGPEGRSGGSSPTSATPLQPSTLDLERVEAIARGSGYRVHPGRATGRASGIDFASPATTNVYDLAGGRSGASGSSSTARRPSKPCGCGSRRGAVSLAVSPGPTSATASSTIAVSTKWTSRRGHAVAARP